MSNEIPADHCYTADGAKSAQDSSHNEARLNSNKAVQTWADLPAYEPTNDTTNKEAYHIQNGSRREKLRIAENRRHESESEKPPD